MITDIRITQSWDTGIKAGAQHDASACATFMARGGEHYLLDMLVVKLEYPELKRQMISHAALFEPHAMLIEDKASGQSLLQDLKRETSLPVIGISATADKLTRLLQVTPMMEAGRVHLPENAPWLAAFESEFFVFPDGAHDDQVDAVSQYLNWQRAQSARAEMSIRRV
ncbi:MAG: phage terminase large subunit [Rickettsiales bacterium]